MLKSILAVILMAVILVILIFVEIPYSVNSRGIALPHQQWYLSKTAAGKLVTTLQNHRTGAINSYSVTEFERDDAVNFVSNDKILNQSNILAGDTIGIFYSAETERRVDALTAKLSHAEAKLASFHVGEKEAVVEEATQNVVFAQQQVAEQAKILERMSALHEQGLISGLEYDIEAGRAHLFNINVRIAEAKLRTVETGARSSEVDVLQVEIDGLRSELGILHRRAASFVLTTPISGIRSRSLSPDTLLIISDTSQYLLSAAVELHHKKHIEPGQTVRISGKESGKVLHIDPLVRTVNQNQFVVVLAELQRSDRPLLEPQQIVDCSVETNSISLLDYLMRWMEAHY